MLIVDTTMVTTVPMDSEFLSKSVGILDLFSGVGGLSYGMTQHSDKFTIEGAIDFDEDAVNTFNLNHSSSIAYQKDLTEYTPEMFLSENTISKDDIDVICGGPPCKGFSSIRPGRSEKNRDDRNYLYQFYFNYIESFNPNVFVMENVPQLINHTNEEGNNVFDSVLERVEDLGYSYEWQLLNASHYGVPQTRTRLFLVGTTETDVPISFPEPIYQIPANSKVKHKDKLLDVSEEASKARNIECALKDLPTLEPGEKKSSYFCDPDELVQSIEKSYVEYLRKENPELTHHEASNNTEMMRKRLSFAGESRDELPEYIFPSSGYSSTYSRLRKEIPSSTLTTNFTTASSTRCIHPYENRALSLREGARIQSFPDSFKFTGSKGDIREQIGNAVPPLLGKAIGTTVANLIN